MLRDSLLFNLVISALATLPAEEFTGFLTAHCQYYGLPQPIRVNMTNISGEPISGPPKILWETCGAKERLMIIMALDDALKAIKKNRAN